MKNQRHGFTCIETLIVILVIAILVMIVIPRLVTAGLKAKEAMLRGDLYQLRNAIQRFEADCSRYPNTLDELMTRPGDVPDAGDVDFDILKTGVVAWYGPYIRTPDGMLPQDPFTTKAGWSYDPKTGEVHSSSTLTAINGELYNTW